MKNPTEVSLGVFQAAFSVCHLGIDFQRLSQTYSSVGVSLFREFALKVPNKGALLVVSVGIETEEESTVKP